MKTLFGIVCIAVMVYLCMAIFLYVFQRDLLYFPTAKYDHPFDRLVVSNQGEKIEVIVLNEGNSKAKIYFGGNGEAVAGNAEAFKLHFPDTTIYLVNYRGYGGSTGVPSEPALYADALAIYDQVNEWHDLITVMGRSLGSGVATYVAVQRPVERVVLITPFDSVLNLAKEHYPLFPVRFLLKDWFDSQSRAHAIKAKVLIVAAENDQLVPMNHTKRLIYALNENQVKVIVLENVGHNDLSTHPDYIRALRDFQ